MQLGKASTKQKKRAEIQVLCVALTSIFVCIGVDSNLIPHTCKR